jgi:hypothetical protein
MNSACRQLQEEGKKYLKDKYYANEIAEKGCIS